MKNRLKKIKIKLVACFDILFKHKHFYIISFDAETLESLVKGSGNMCIGTTYHGMQKKQIYQMSEVLLSEMFLSERMEAEMQFEKGLSEFIEKKSK